MSKNKRPKEGECDCTAARKLKAYTLFLLDLADLAGTVAHVDKESKVVTIAPLQKFDVVERTRKILRLYGDYEGDVTH